VDRHVPINILSSPAHNSVCPIKLLIIHALRIGAVDATTWEQIRANAIARADRTIQWITPENPVIPAITMGRNAFLDLEKPASTHQVIATMNSMSVKAKCVARLRVHDLRYGAARDFAHLPAGALRGYSNMTVASALGHKMSTFMNDVTEQYVGGSAVSSWNLRAQSDWVDTRAPRMGSTDFVPRPLREGELQDYCRARGLNPSKEANIRNARIHLRKAQETEWRASLKDEPAKASSSAPKFGRKHNPLAWPAFCANATLVLQPLGGNSSRGINADVTSKRPPAKHQVPTPKDIQLPAAFLSANALSSDQLINDDSDEEDNDPNLKVLGVEEQDNALQLLEIVTAQIDTADLATDTDADVDLLDALDEGDATFDTTDPIHSSLEGFIEYFSRINIIRNEIAAKLSDARFQQEVAKWAPQGNSRDIPTRFIHHCSNRDWGCKYECHGRIRLNEHFRTCKISESNPVKAAEFICRKPDCNREFQTASGRKSHEAEHGFQHRQCNLCPDDRWYKTATQWNVHQRDHHGDWDPSTTCAVPRCARGEMPFKTRTGYQQHLRVTHKLKGPDAAKYITPTAVRATTWGKRKCPFEDYTHETTRKDVM
jgi:hypothetical protein